MQLCWYKTKIIFGLSNKDFEKKNFSITIYKSNFVKSWLFIDLFGDDSIAGKQ